jgi:hypothetical protein
MKFNKTPKLWLLGLIVLLFTAGCTELPAETPASTSDRGLDPAVPEPVSLPEGVVLSYQRSGGIAGMDESWLVYEDGRIEGPDGLVSNSEPAQVEQLLADLEEAGFFGLDSQTTPENPCCDRYVYVLTVRAGEQAQQMTAVEAVESVPAELWDSLEIVQAFLEPHTP